jgi:hypothetical protein
MKKLLLSLTTIFFGIAVNAQLLNGGFESPATSLLPNIATDSPGWGTGFYTVETTGAYAGTQFGKMKTIVNPAVAAQIQFPSDTLPGFIQQFVTGPISNPASWTLNYAYKNITSAGDSAVVVLQIYDTLTADPNDDVVMYGAIGAYSGSTTNWTMESIPVQAFNTTGYTANAYVVIASASIGFLFGNGFGYPGSELWLDAISINTSADVIELSSNLKVYPNPANDVLNISANGEISNVTILTLDGKVVLSSSSSTINVSELTSGMYIYQVIVNDKISTGNFVKQ